MRAAAPGEPIPEVLVERETAIDLGEVEKARVLGNLQRIQTIDADEIAHANRPSTQMLLAISAMGKHLYQGTVSGAEKDRRRARDKRARRARKAARR